MRIRSHSWGLFVLLSVGCGYVGVGDFEQEQLEADSVHPDASGGKSDGESGGDTGAGDGDGDSSGGVSSTGTGGAGDEASGGGGSGGGEVTDTGGADGSGGDLVEMGGATSGTGGSWTTEAQEWTDPDRTGCEPFCKTYNATFSTHFLFEQSEVPAPGVTENGELFISTDYANWGESSLGISFDESPSSAYIPIDIETGLGSWIHVRTWLYIPSDVVTGDIRLLEFLSGDVPAASVATHPGARLSATAPIDDVTVISKEDSYPLDEWFCLRVALYTDHFDGSVTVEAGGSVVTEVSGVDTRWVIDADAVNFGVTETGPTQGAGTIYWDSIVIDQDPVECGTMTAPQSL